MFDDNPRRDSLIFVVHMWNPEGPESRTIWEVMGRQKDLQYVSPDRSHVARQKQLHRLLRVIAELGRRLPESVQAEAGIRELRGYGCLTRMLVVWSLARRTEK